jgi:redox-sensitive bicupin YhaK (pirin superfamily)
VRSVPASYEQRLFAQADKHNRLCLIASPDGAANSLTIHQDARVFASVQDPGVALSHALPNARLAYLHVIAGEITINGHTLGPGDAAKIRDESALNVQANQASEWLLFDLPPAT